MEWVEWVEWVAWAEWECNTKNSLQVSKKTRRTNTSGLFFCSLCGHKLGNEGSDELKFILLKRIIYNFKVSGLNDEDFPK